MKQIMLTLLTLLTSITNFLDMPEVPFSYRFEIVSNSRSVEDVTALYYYKEQLIDTYEQYFMPISIEQRATCIKNSINMFSFNSSARSYYIGGSIVVLLGKAQGVEMHGELRKNECDATVIREKIYIFDLFA